jgi:autotransporter adhesin
VLGTNSTVSGAGAIAVGNGVSVTGANAVAVGNGTSANFANSIAIGTGATATRANQQVFGTGASTYTMAGIGSAASKTAQSGPTQIVTADASGNLATTTLGALGVASTADVSAINAQLAGLNGRVDALTSEARRGIAATAALAPVAMPSAPERTTFSLNTGFFHGETGLGFGFAHRLTTAIPLAIHGSYGNGGGYEHVGRLGMTVEF